MIPYTLHIDTLRLQAEFYNNSDQQAVTNNICQALRSSYPYLHIDYNTNKHNKNINTHVVQTAGKNILIISTGSYSVYNRAIYYVTVELAGLKSYDIKIDTISYNCLIRVVAFFNTNNITFDYTGTDIAVDIECPFRHIFAFCNKKAPRVNYYHVGESQWYATTHYIEKYNRTHKRVMKRAQVYDKSIKEDGLTYPITRFELKLQSSFFNRYPYRYGMLQDELDRYHILYFPTLDEKDAALTLYAQYEDSIRRRDLHKLGFNRYRIVANTREIENFLFSLYDVYEDDLELPVVEMDDGFDWLFE